MNKIPLDIITITAGLTQNPTYAVVLGERKGNRRLPIVIGNSEAQAIVVGLENMPPSRPLTHDLIKNILETFDAIIKEIVICKVVDGIFYSQLICVKDEQEYIIDSRTSDAIAIAVRYSCPIYVYSNVLESNSVDYIDTKIAYPENEEGEGQEENYEVETEASDFSIFTQKELEVLLNEALEMEDYERAARVRDELSRRGKA